MALTPLFKPENASLFSNVFTVPEGKCCVLHAVGLKREKIRTDASEIKVAQQVCVRRMVHSYRPDDDDCECSCGCSFDMDDVSAKNIADQPVVTCSGPWALSACDNLRIIGVPGTYRLELNDSTAIESVQVFADMYDNHAFASQVTGLFFN